MATKLTNAERHGRDGARAMGLDPDAPEKAQHTPGPWLGLLDEEVNIFKVFGPRNEFVARIEPNRHQNAANASLIAAAPDTAEACRAMAILIEDDHKRHCNNDNTDGPITDCDPEDCYLRSRWDKVHNAAKKAGVL